LPSLSLPAAGTDASSAAVPQLWWSLFQSPKLDETVRIALAGNRDLKAAQATLKEANELLGVSRAARLPEATLEAGNGRQKLGAAFLGGFQLPPFTYYSVGANVSYLLDSRVACAEPSRNRRSPSAARRSTPRNFR
jgi:outer membrane protein TolC